MKVLLSWLRDFAPIETDPEELGLVMGDLGMAVEDMDVLGEGLVASAHAADGTVEALELPDSPGFVLGVQWHPEAGEDLRLMKALVDAAAARSLSA